MNKKIEYITESEEMEEMADNYGEALCDIAHIVDNEQPSKRAFEAIREILERAGFWFKVPIS